MKYRLIITVLAALFLGACATLEFGSDFDPKQFETWVKRGETTQKEVREYLGPPTATGAVVENDGTYHQRWLYYYGKGKITKKEGRP